MVGSILNMAAPVISLGVVAVVFMIAWLIER